MRILVYPHDLALGGSQINAIDLASAMRDHGHETIVYGVPGPLEPYIAQKGLQFISASPWKVRPAPSRVWQLASVVRRQRIDLIHAYEWPPCLDAYYGAHLVWGTPIVCTVLSMALTPLVPGSVPLVVGTRQLEEEARRTHEGPVELLEPPIDTDADHPSADGSTFLRQLGIDDGGLVVALVSRLSIDLKLDSLERAVDAVGLLAADLPVRLVLVGDGQAFEPLRRRAESINARLGQRAVILTGPMLDPRPAYAAADVVLGMGSSILRGMAFGKPAVVQGAAGFSEVFSSATQDLFLWQGFYGLGNGEPGPDLLRAQLAGLLRDEERRRSLGLFGRRFVEEHVSLRSAASILETFYLNASRSPAPRSRRLREAIRVGALASAAELRYHLPSYRRHVQAEARRLSESGLAPLPAASMELRP